MARRKSSKKRPLSGEARRASRPAERRRPERSTKRDAVSSTRSGPAAASVVTGPKTSPDRTRTSSPLRRPPTPRRRDPETAPPEPIARAGAGASEASLEQPLDLQPGPPPVLGGVPWGYGQTRITAMARDPHWIFAYWEFTDDALARARAAVHEQDAPCHLRVYDTTYRLFDGTNANWDVDLPVDRVTRDYYLHVNRPGSTVHVDVGVKSHQGGFATIARSGPVETPRDGVSTDTRVEWMTVEADGGARPEYRHRFAPRSGTVASLGMIAPGGQAAAEPDRVEAALLGEAWIPSEWTETEMGGRVVRWFRWIGPTRTERWWSQRAGPFTRIEIRLEGEHRLVRLEHGAQVAVGPWELRISGLDAWGERRTLDRWTIHYAWMSGEGGERVDTPAILARILGGYRTRVVPVGSEGRLDRGAWSSEWLQRGASEWRWLGGGEAELGGASELRFLGASELGWLGASEQRLVWRERAASRRRQRGPLRRVEAIWRERVARRREPGRTAAHHGGAAMSQGYLALVLHAHLPFVRHPAHPYFLEEQWFFQAMTETYIPLIHVFEGLRRDDIDFRLTLSLSPPLVSMMRDALLLDRYAQRLDRLVELGHREVERTRPDPTFGPLAELYRNRMTRIRDTFRRYEGNVPRAFGDFEASGQLELITCNATHMFLPLADRNWAVCHAQIELAAREHERHLGRRPRGMWLAECGYFRGLDELLRESGVRFFFVDTHGLLFADRRPVYGVYAPVYCPTGVAAFGRDVESSKQVWSAEEGYPGDGVYREFYRDIGFDLDLSYIGPYVHPEGLRHDTGFKYHRITDRRTPLHAKEPYDPLVAHERAADHAGNFLWNRERQVEYLASRMDRPPIVVAPYDAELFGHWWFEGPVFLDVLFRKMQYDQATVAPITPSEYLARYPTNQVTTPCTSSWGYKGYAEVWLNRANDWTYPHLHRMGEGMVDMARSHPDARGLRRRALDQAARELLLAQASDWSFIMKTGTMVPYAVGRVRDHVARFNALEGAIREERIHEPWLKEIEEQDNIFPDLDYRIYTR